MAGIMERRQEVETELRDALQSLRANKEKVPEELLMTKYKRSYERLKRKIRELAEEYASIYVLYGIRFQKEDIRKLASAINRTIRRSGIMPQISVALYEHQDMDEMKTLLNSLEKLVWNAAIPYMKSYKDENMGEVSEDTV